MGVSRAAIVTSAAVDRTFSQGWQKGEGGSERRVFGDRKKENGEGTE